jgi:trk system potassium uptake protein
MVEWLRTIGRDLGLMLQALSVMLFVSLIIPTIWQEYYAIPGLLFSGLITFGAGAGLAKLCANTSEPGKLHGMMIAASGWFLIALFGALPFYFIAWTVALDPTFLTVPQMQPEGYATLAVFRQPINGIFESMSGFTGTGLTMTDR